MDDVREATNCGKFGYEVLSDDMIIPYIFRENERYCATKIFQWNFDKQKTDLTWNLTDFQYLKGYDMYRDDVTLMNEINEWHNNSMYPFRFTTNDSLVKVADIRAIFKYLNDCREKARLGDQYEMMAGMIQIRFEKCDVVWPYVVQNGKRYTPTNILNVPRTLCSTVILTDIEVMYMNYILSVLKIEMATTKPFNMPCVLLDEAVAHFIEESHPNENYDFDDNYWPTKKNTRKIDTKQPESLNNNNLPFFSTAKINEIAESKNPVETKTQDNQKKTTTSRKRQMSTLKIGSAKKKTKTKATPHFYEVDYLVDIKKEKDGTEKVKVHWKGYSSDDDSWEPVSNLNEALIEDVDALRKDKAKNQSK